MRRTQPDREKKEFLSAWTWVEIPRLTRARQLQGTEKGSAWLKRDQWERGWKEGGMSSFRASSATARKESDAEEGFKPGSGVIWFTVAGWTQGCRSRVRTMTVQHLLKVEENPPSTREKKNKHICRYTLVVETIRQPDRGAMGLEERMSQEWLLDFCSEPLRGWCYHLQSWLRQAKDWFCLIIVSFVLFFWLVGWLVG